MRRSTACLIFVAAQMADLMTTKVALTAGATEVNPLSTLSWPVAVAIKVTAVIVVAVTLQMLPERFKPVQWAVILSLLACGVSLWNLSQAMIG